MTGSSNQDSSPGGIDRRTVLNTVVGTPVGLSLAASVSGDSKRDPGAELWRFETEADFVRSSPTIVQDTVYVGSPDDHVYALDAQTGFEKWAFETQDSVGSSPNVVGGTVYIGSSDHHLLAIDARTGDLEWAYRMVGAVGSSPTVFDGTVYVGDHNGVLAAVDAAIQEAEWIFETGGPILSSPTVVDDTVYVGSDDGNVYAIATADGTERWRYESDALVRSAPTVVDGIVYVGLNQIAGEDDEGLFALRADTGEVIWHFEPERTDTKRPSVTASPTVWDGTVYVGTYDERIYALDATDGTERWQFETEDWVTGTSPTVADGIVYSGSEDGNLYALATDDGTEHWRFETDAGFDSSPTVVDGMVYVGGMDGNVYAIDADGEGSSQDSRVELGTLGHHHTWANEEPGPPEGLIDEPIRKGPLDLSDVGLAKSDAAPFEFVEITGLPDGVDVNSIHGEYRDADSPEPIQPDVASPMALLGQPNRIVGYDDRDGIYLHTPVPDPDGTSLRVKITDGESYSRALELDVRPLPDAATAQGSFDEYVSALRDLLRTTTEAYGLNYPDDLQAFLDDPESIDPVYTGLLRAYDMLDNPETEASLVNRDRESQAVKELERVLHHTRIPEQVRGLAAFAGSDDTLIDDAVQAIESTDKSQRQDRTWGHDHSLTSRNDLSQLGGPLSSISLPAQDDRWYSMDFPDQLDGPTASTRPRPTHETVFEPLYDIDGPDELSQKMRTYHEKHGNLEDTKRIEEGADNLDTLTSATSALSDSGATSTGTSNRSGSGKKNKLELILLGVSIGIGVSNFVLGFYPCCISRTRIQDPAADIFRLENEDAAKPQLEVRDVRVEAESDREVADELLDRTVGQLEDAVSGLVTERLPDALTDFEEEVADDLASYGASEAFDQVNLNQELYFEWTAIDLLGDMASAYTTEELITSAGPVIWNIPERPLGPHETLPYELDPETFFRNESAVNHLYLTPHPENFPPGGHPDGRLSIQATTITVNFPKAVWQVEPGETYEIDFHIHNSVLEEDPPYRDIDLSPGHGEIERPPTKEGEGHFSITYHAPEEVGDDFEEEITVTAHSWQGVREYPLAIDRIGGASLTTGGSRVQVSQTGCLEPGDTALLRAVVEPEDETLTWDSSAGHLNVAADTHSAVFTATQNTGDVTVTVTTEDSGAVATTTVPVQQECFCGAEIYSGLGSVEVVDESVFGLKANAWLFPSTRWGGEVFTTEDPSQFWQQPNARWGVGTREPREGGDLPGSVGISFPERKAVVMSDDINTDPRVTVAWDDPWSPSIRFSHRANYVIDSEDGSETGTTYLSGRIRPRVLEPPSDGGARPNLAELRDIDVEADHVLNHGTHFEDLISGIKWSNCTSKLCRYTNSDGLVGTPQLLEALEDWRQGEVDTELVGDVVEEWRSDEPIDNCSQ